MSAREKHILTYIRLLSDYRQSPRLSDIALVFELTHGQAQKSVNRLIAQGRIRSVGFSRWRRLEVSAQ